MARRLRRPDRCRTIEGAATDAAADNSGGVGWRSPPADLPLLFSATQSGGSDGSGGGWRQKDQSPAEATPASQATWRDRTGGRVVATSAASATTAAVETCRFRRSASRRLVLSREGRGASGCAAANDGAPCGAPRFCRVGHVWRRPPAGAPYSSDMGSACGEATREHSGGADHHGGCWSGVGAATCGVDAFVRGDGAATGGVAAVTEGGGTSNTGGGGTSNTGGGGTSAA